MPRLHIWVALAATLLLSACAAPQTRALLAQPASLASPVELNAVPFYPQTEHQCGPAALATVLQYVGVDTSPEALTPQVFLPGREGSLAIEMLAATRRHDRVAYRIPPRLDAALAEVAAGRPVLILQNRSLPISPLWHYAVLVGYDLQRRQAVLRSGITQREVMPLDTFEHTWARGDFWGMVAVAPEQIPGFVPPTEALRQALALERIERHRAAHQLYAAIVQRWPGENLARFGLGNTAYRLGDLAGAEAAWLPLLEQAEPQLAWYYNLASLYQEQRRWREAQRVLAQAQRHWPNDQALLELGRKLPSSN